MRILAIEFSSSQRSVAVVCGESAEKPLVAVETVETGGKGTKALGLVDEALRRSHLERTRIDRVAVGLGPGSYTGIRSAIALAQGWHLAREVKLVGISSVECIAAEAWDGGLRGSVAVLVDGQRGEFYLGTFELRDSGYHQLQPLRLVSAAEAQAAQAAGNHLIGPEVTRWFPAGKVVFPRAERLGKLAIGRTELIEAERLEPIYLRQTSFVKAPPPRVLPT